MGLQVQHGCCELIEVLCALDGGNYAVATRLLPTLGLASTKQLAELTAHVMELQL